MKRFPALRSLIASIALATAGHADADSTTGRWLSGQDAYQKVCAHCHASRATRTSIGPVLTGRNLPPVFITTVVRMGIGAMPAFRESEIDDEVLNSLARFISTGASGAKQ